MQSFEFYATAENGYIRIPEKYKKKVGTKVKVVVENDELLSVDWNALFPPMVDTRGWKFDREEANER